MKKPAFFISVLLLPAFLFAQQIINVPGDYPTIQQGIDAANPGDTVLVADGHYYEQISFLGKKPLLVTSHYILTGNINHISNTIIDGSQLTDMNSASVVQFISNEDTTSILCGFTICGGKGTYVPILNDRSGGGIFISGSGARIVHNKITGNIVDDTGPVSGQGVYGGGIGTKNADGDYWLVIEHNWIYENSAVTKFDWSCGGGIYTTYNARIEGNEIYENSSLSLGANTWGQGGGISHLGTGATNTLIINNNNIHNNTAQSDAGVGTDGGVGTQFAHLIFTNNEVAANNGITPSTMGGVGGLSVIDPAEGCHVSGNIFSTNISTNFGGGIHLENYSASPDPNLVLISENFFLYNYSDAGGAVSDINIPIVFQNNVCKGNHSTNRGGAILLVKSAGYSFGHLAKLVNNSFSDNASGSYGGAIYSQLAKPLVFNSVFYNNSAGTEGMEIYLNHFSDTLDLAYSDINTEMIYGKIVDGGGNFNIDPDFADPELLTLNMSSPCLDAGTQSYVCACGHLNFCPMLDLQGISRPQGPGVDMGAYEMLIEGLYDNHIMSESGLEINPNPIFDHTTITYELNREMVVQICLYNSNGLLIRILYTGTQAKGCYSREFDAAGLSPGIYIFRLTAGDQSYTRKALVLR